MAINHFSPHLVSRPALADGSVSSGLAVGVDATGALRAGVSVAPHEGIPSVARRTLADGSVACKYNSALQKIRFYGDPLSVQVGVF